MQFVSACPVPVFFFIVHGYGVEMVAQCTTLSFVIVLAATSAHIS